MIKICRTTRSRSKRRSFVLVNLLQSKFNIFHIIIIIKISCLFCTVQGGVHEAEPRVPMVQSREAHGGKVSKARYTTFKRLHRLPWGEASLASGWHHSWQAGRSVSLHVSLPPSPSPIGVNIRERKIVTKRTKKQEKRESTPPCDEMLAKPPSSIFSPPECASGTALHRVDTTWI